MQPTDNFASQITDNLDEGIICINKSNIITLFNKKAKEILGITTSRCRVHPSGHIVPGDIVIIADNSLGSDDGDMKPSDLSCLNISEPSLSAGDTIIAVGVYKNPQISPVLHYWKKSVLASYNLNTHYLGFKIDADIDTINKCITICVDDIGFSIKYFNSLGHMVVIDGSTGQIKFFEEKGYTYRREEINTLLKGGAFLEKGATSIPDDVVGLSLEDIIEYSSLLDDADELLRGNIKNISGKYYELNKRPAICSLYPFRLDDKTNGCMIRLKDASELEELINDRNQILSDMELLQSNTLSGSLIPKDSFKSFVGSSTLISQVKYLAYKSSKYKFNVIITGESGTGKSILAREIHNLTQKDAPFIEVNCNAIPANLFESELFGYVGGAFTGALPGGKIGYIEMANGGTLFLDEIGEIPLDIQAKLLHVIEKKSFYKVGSTKPTATDVRIITATNRNLYEEVKSNRFRQDLYYRLNVYPIDIPPLREHTEDIYILINKILDELCTTYKMSQKQLSGNALKAILSYSWPGNVRELENTLERAVAICEGDIIYPEHLNIARQEYEPLTLKMILADCEKKAILDAIDRYGSDRDLILRELDISKSSFYEKVKKYGIKDV